MTHSDTTTDEIILAALDNWREWHRAQRVTEQSNLWAKIDGAEIAIRHCNAKSPQGVIAQLLIALTHIEVDRRVETTILSGDMEAVLALDESLDWGVRLILAAIRSLQGMEAQS